jgi:hypothetical protein
MIENKTRLKIHSSHKMTNWKPDVVRFPDRPRICDVRKCEFCEARLVEGEDIKFNDSQLRYQCKGGI